MGSCTTGLLIKEKVWLYVHRFMSGPLGGDLQLGAAIASNKLDILIFFWDHLQAQPHDVVVKALIRICVVYNIPLACNRSSADFLLSSLLLTQPYQRYGLVYGTRLR